MIHLTTTQIIIGALLIGLLVLGLVISMASKKPPATIKTKYKSIDSFQRGGVIYYLDKLVDGEYSISEGDSVMSFYCKLDDAIYEFEEMKRG